MKIYKLTNIKENLLETVENFDWLENVPGGWLDYGPPRKVCGYGDGSLYTDDGQAYGFHYKRTSWSASIPINKATAVAKTETLPKKFLKTGILKNVRDSLRDYGAMVDDHSGTGIWCNYYSQRKHRISPHKDNENYYEKNYKNEPLFVSLTLYKDNSDSLENLARFQIKKENKWQTIDLPHMSLLVMSGNIEHRVMESVPSKPFRERFNITFRTPVRLEIDLIKNYRFFSNFGRYYKKPYLIYLPDVSLEKIDKLKNAYQKLGKIIYKKEKILNRNDLIDIIQTKFKTSRPPATTTNMSLVTLIEDII